MAGSVVEHARNIVESPSLASKLTRFERPLRDPPHPALRLTNPGRPPELVITPARKARVPPIEGFADPAQRARILHALANHELQAVELFAWALCAFPDTPESFRRGLVGIAEDEQRHAELYLERLSCLGHQFGDFPVTGHFWHQIDSLTTPLRFVCAMGLTFENANLDFALDYADAATLVRDHQTARVLEQVHKDEVRHVAFAWRWLGRMKDPDQDPWSAYVASLTPPLGPQRARGARMSKDSRRQAGLAEPFIAHLEATSAKRPSGAPR